MADSNSFTRSQPWAIFLSPLRGLGNRPVSPGRQNQHDVQSLRSANV